MVSMSTIPAKLTEPMGKEAELYHRLPSGKIQCTACARMCQIGEGQVGLCGVRGVVGGKLYLLVYGKIIAGHIDPIEKKPVVHYKPGSKVFSIATTGCSWLCHYCFTPETTIVTDQGVKDLGRIFQESDKDGEIAYPDNLRALSHTGLFRPIVKVFKHRYKGKMLRIRPYYLPEVRCTPNHKIFVFDQKTGALQEKRADELTRTHLLAVPKVKDYMVSKSIDTRLILNMAIPRVHKKAKRNSVWELREKEGRLKFGTSRGWGIPRFIELDGDFAELLGLYCAEGSISRQINRPNSWAVAFSFGAHEEMLISRTEELVKKVFGIRTARVRQGSVIRVTTSNNVLGVFLNEIVGNDGLSKRVPEMILHNQTKDILARFLRGYTRGDGYITRNRKETWLGTSSVSRELTLGAWYITFRLGLAPRFYVANNAATYEIEERVVNRHNDYLTRVMVKPETTSLDNLSIAATKMVERDDYTLVPIRTIAHEEYDGFVYNMEVEGDHSYTASFVSVSNCQNYDISQRRKIEGTEMTPTQVVELTESYGCEGLAYTYNQPTIFIEYARDVGKIAHEKGIFNIFVSNGYDTPETVGLMKEFLDCVTVDFKGSGETEFVRRYIGIQNAEPIFQSLLEVKNKTKIHTEITDLIIPQVGDNLDAAEKLCRWVYDNLGPDTPVHFLRFHPDYKMMEFPWTPVETLERHYEIGKKAGLNYVYIGNVPGHPKENTYCPGCGRVLIKRYSYDILEYNLDKHNRCKFCGHQTPIIGPLSKSARDDRFIPVIN